MDEGKQNKSKIFSFPEKEKKCEASENDGEEKSRTTILLKEIYLD